MGYRRGGINSTEDRKHILNIIDEACKAGACQQASCKLLEITPRTLQRWRKEGQMLDKRTTRTVIPHNKLTIEEEKEVLKVVNERKYSHLSPAMIVPLLADEQRYIASESTIYRLLKKEGQMRHRASSKPCSRYKPKAIRAIKPNQVYSWDITYLLTTVRGVFFYLYLFMDIYSRKIVGWQVYDRESSEYSADVLEAIYLEECITGKDQVILHSDNGAPMKGATMLATLQKLGIIPSFSRPGVSNDNPYSEALFRTIKYAPIYPEKPFENLHKAREWVGQFVKWYNNEHLHSGIKFVTPVQRHTGWDEEILRKREEVYLKAKNNKPYRWSNGTRNWNKDYEVLLNPEKCKSVSRKLGVAV